MAWPRWRTGPGKGCGRRTCRCTWARRRSTTAGPCWGKLGAYVRGGLARRDSKAVDEHVSACEECHGVLLELTDVNRGLRVMVGPLIAGPLFGGYAAALARPGAVGAGGALRLLRRLRRVPRQQQVAVAGGTVAVDGGRCWPRCCWSPTRSRSCGHPRSRRSRSRPRRSRRSRCPCRCRCRPSGPRRCRLRPRRTSRARRGCGPRSTRSAPSSAPSRASSASACATMARAPPRSWRPRWTCPTASPLSPRRGAATAQRCSPPSARSTAGPAARSAAAPGAPGSRCRRGRARRCSCGCWWPTRRRRARGPPSASPPARCGSRPGPRRAYGPPARPPGSPPTGRWRSGRSATRC
ncbi:zf-HC2 domain-containing protein [Nonomuraea rubra]|uniref:zf-HC2 domain-containing protein n=1 Tax=Nonomuraea rubra TaxID=46180 RepID=UPI003CD05F25